MEMSGESLAAVIICHFSSSAGAGFFLVEKKDKTLQPCIEDRGLNDIAIKNRYALPLISSVFEQLQGASIFTKLDLRSCPLSPILIITFMDRIFRCSLGVDGILVTSGSVLCFTLMLWSCWLHQSMTTSSRWISSKQSVKLPG